MVQGPRNLLRRHRWIKKAYADSVVDSICDRRCGHNRGQLGDTFGTEWAFGTITFNKVQIQLRHIRCRHDFVIPKAGILDFTFFQLQLLAKGIAQSDSNSAFNLTFQTDSVHDSPHILGHGNFVDLDFPGFSVDTDFCNIGGVGPGGREIPHMILVFGLAGWFVVVGHHHQFGVALKMHVPQQFV